ncbi:MAG: DUF1189 family protein [Desulfomonilaceae bacterium]|nr:DUF1189 family protein [Desulfomonilaceae bacterium]
MGTARSITRTHGLVAALIVAVCIGVSSWGLMSALVPKAEWILDQAVEQYDTYLPEITIRNGQASIRGEQPFRLEELEREGAFLVIDTREGKHQEALDYLKEAHTGLVLTRDSLIVKNQNQIKIVPLKDFPDITVNSEEIRAFVHAYLPMVVQWVWGLVIVYFMFAKSVQLLVLGMIPYFGARSYSVDLTYGEALKIASFAMVPVVILDVLLHLSGTSIAGSFVLYFSIYIGLLILSVWELVKSDRRAGPGDDALHPS